MIRHLRAVYIAITWLLATYLVVSALWPPAALPLALTVMILALLFELYLDAITEGDISGIVWGCLLFAWLVLAAIGLARALSVIVGWPPEL